MTSDYRTHHRPRFHLSQSTGYLNDPNGPVEVGTTTHLFFQSRRTTDTADAVEWGHASSDDLVDWTIHPSALVPTDGGLDTDGCWSGNTVRSPEGIRAFYSGHERTRPLERVLTALSRDGGATFSPPDLLMPDPDPAHDVRMLRDPFVWSDRSGTHMVLGSIVGDHAALRLYEHSDAGWSYARELASMPRSTVRGIDTGEGWECPQIIRLGQTEVALLGSWSFAGGTSQVLAFPVADVARMELLDLGDSYYAPSVMRESTHGPVVFGWLRETRDTEWWQSAGWAGAISLPRTAWLEGGSVRSEPLRALEGLRQGEAAASDEVEIGAQAELLLDHESRRTRITFGTDEWLEFDVDVTADTLTVVRSNASRDERAASTPVQITGAFGANTDRPAVRAFLDGSVLEIFTSAGRSAAIRVYPSSPPPWRVTMGDGTVVWRLRSAVVDHWEPAATARTGSGS